jgi:hypothetical protein
MLRLFLILLMLRPYKTSIIRERQLLRRMCSSQTYQRMPAAVCVRLVRMPVAYKAKRKRGFLMSTVLSLAALLR